MSSTGLNDRLYGGEGNDNLSLGRYETDPVGRVLMQGGNGNDGFGGQIHNATRVNVIGGAGRDDFYFNGSDGSVVIRAGLDDDIVWLTFDGLAMDVALGSGRPAKALRLLGAVSQHWPEHEPEKE